MARFFSLSAALVAALLALPATPARAMTPVDLELLLAVDISSSVSYDEYRLQMAGYADAFRSDTLVDAIRRAAPRGIAAALVQWSGTGEQWVVVDWARIDDGASATAFADRIEGANRAFRGSQTDIGDALRFAAGLFADNGYLSPRQIIDVSGDGRSNQGGAPGAGRDAALARGLTVNGLAVRSDVPTLDGYYLDNVIGGPASFALSADSFEDFAAAILGKLIVEIAGIPVADRDWPAYVAASTPARKAARLAPREALR
jgi:hypothetical protein